MGLSASQARLLTITARKSDCEFQSMRYSHEKIALSRSMTDVSNEYQNALNQTKLVYDFYGNGDVNTPLTYGLMMTPSELNGHMPILTTDASGKAVLNSQYASAARAAGIPQEGLGCLPSSDVRNKFLQGLADNGLISHEAAKTYMGIQYSQGIGLGSTDLVTENTKQMTLKEIIEQLDQNFQIDLSDADNPNGTWLRKLAVSNNGQVLSHGTVANIFDVIFGAKDDELGSKGKITFTDLFTGNYAVYSVTLDNNGDHGLKDCNQKIEQISHMSCWEDMFAAFDSVLGGTSLTDNALDYALQQTRNLIYNSESKTGYVGYDGEFVYGEVLKVTDNDKSPIESYGWGGYESKYKHDSKKDNWVAKRTVKNVGNYIGYYAFDGRNSSGVQDTYDSIGISITNIAKAFFTYYIQYIEGYGKSHYAMDNDKGMQLSGGLGSHSYFKNQDGEAITTDTNRLIDLDSDYLFTVVDNTGINTDQGLNSGFYDAMFNQICMRGWLENGEVDDKKYLQEMLQTGKLFLATCTDDGYYYQGNYQTNTYIKEVTDDDAIAKAEARYNTEKQKLNHKEEIIDLKMKNLDTEISSLTTEYDTVKSLISKNIEKGFKRYDA